ncbi:MAG: urease accessory protein UreD [Actinobacteria bacterium]|nr:urease accessory protein UreD [Actinomycetota bacterium]
MDATTEVEVGLDARGRSVVRRMHCEAPLLVRVAGTDSSCLLLVLVNGAAGPLGGDRLRFRLRLAAGTDVDVRSVAASMVQPGPRGAPSSYDVDLEVGDGARLRWSPEPTVSVCGSDHRTTVRLSAPSTADVRVREVVALGRHDEIGGRLALHQRVVVDGLPVLDHEIVFGGGALAGPGAQGPGRRFASEVIVGGALPAAGTRVDAGCASGVVHLSPVCALSSTVS